MTLAERKRYDAKMAARRKAKDIADKKKKYVAKQKKAKETKQEQEGKAYGNSRIKIQRRIREEQRKGLSYKEKKALREQLAKRESYGAAESGTYRTFGDVYHGVGPTPQTTWSKGDKPVKKSPTTKKTIIKKGGKKTYKGKIPITIKKKK